MAMELRPTIQRYTALLFLALAGAFLLPNAHAASCKTQSQMTAAQRDTLFNAAQTLAGEVQRGDVQALRADTIPTVAADFGGIATTITNLKPLIQQAAITIDNLYLLDAATQAAGTPQTNFFCGLPVVVLNFNNLPSGTYAVAVLHATGVQQPQQISFVLSQSADSHWMLAGFLSRPMLEADHNGLWYWQRAREYSQKKMDWPAWFYYQIAEYLLNPADFFSSPNLDKLQHEASLVHPATLPSEQPVMLNGHGSAFQLTAVSVTTALGGLDLEVHYVPNPMQAAQLHDPAAARQQVLAVMTALLTSHPGLRSAFRGIWVHADEGNASVFALDLTMDQIGGGSQPVADLKKPAPALGMQ